MGHSHIVGVVSHKFYSPVSGLHIIFLRNVLSGILLYSVYFKFYKKAMWPTESEQCSLNLFIVFFIN